MTRRPSSTRGVDRRTDPVVGEVTQQPLPERRPRAGRERSSARSQRPRGLWIALAVLVVVIIGALAWSQRATLRSWLPSTAYNKLLKRADAALVAGKLNGYEGTSARELYARAAIMEPDDARARSGLQRVGEAEVARARAALKAGDLQAATLALGQARTLLGGGHTLDALAQAIVSERGRGVKIASLIDRAHQAMLDQHVAGEHGAASLYQQVLAADPGNAVAAHGMDTIGQRYAAQIRSALGQHDLEDAWQRLQQLAAWRPDFAQLPALRGAVAQAQRDAQAALAQQLAQAQADLDAGRIDGPGDANALARYQSVLNAHPDNKAAAAGLKQVAAALLQRASASVASGQLDSARTDLKRAVVIDPAAAQVTALRQRLAAASQAAALPAKPAAPTPLTTAQRQQVRDLLVRAQAAASDGALLQPPGKNAYDLYHAALAIDAGNADAIAGLASLPSQARTAFADAIGADKLDRAGTLLTAFARLVPGSSSQAPMQKALTDAWVDRVQQRAAAGDTGGARQALSQVRRLAPHDARIAALASRLGG